MQITGLSWCGTRTEDAAEVAHFRQRVLGLTPTYTEPDCPGTQARPGSTFEDLMVTATNSSSADTSVPAARALSGHAGLVAPRAQPAELTIPPSAGRGAQRHPHARGDPRPPVDDVSAVTPDDPICAPQSEASSVPQPPRTADILRGEPEAFASSVAVAHAAIATATSCQPAYFIHRGRARKYRSCRSGRPQRRSHVLWHGAALHDPLHCCPVTPAMRS
jgi:hypothetical protein